MADPKVISCPAGQWTKVFMACRVGSIHILNFKPGQYLHTYRLSGTAAPTEVTEGARFDGPTEVIKNSDSIDVYVYVVTTEGKVRVDR